MVVVYLMKIALKERAPAHTETGTIYEKKDIVGGVL